MLIERRAESADVATHWQNKLGLTRLHPVLFLHQVKVARKLVVKLSGAMRM